MTINSLSPFQSTVIGGLGTQTFNVVVASFYTCEFKIFVPYKPAGSADNSSVTTGGSSCLVVVNLNGAPVLTMGLPSANQPLIGGSVRMNCAVNDVITVVLSSAALADNLPNAIKGIVNVYQGV